MSTALNQDIQTIARSVDQAKSAVQRNDWLSAEQALTEVQDRVGRLLREIGLLKSAPPVPAIDATSSDNDDTER